MARINTQLAAFGLITCLAATARAQMPDREPRTNDNSGSPTNMTAPVPSRAPTAAFIVNGDLWMRSSEQLRKAFLVGASNMVALESAYAKKNGTVTPVAGARAAKALDAMTLDQVAARITRWYQANPTRRQVPVIGVIWMDMVKSDTLR